MYNPALSCYIQYSIINTKTTCKNVATWNFGVRYSNIYRRRQQKNQKSSSSTVEHSINLSIGSI